MKKLFFLISIIFIGALNASGAVIKSQYTFDGNNIRTNIWNTGILFQDLRAFSIPEDAFTGLKIYDVNGREIAVLENKILLKGDYEYQWNAANFPSGIYFYKLQTEKFSQTRKMILVK